MKTKDLPKQGLIPNIINPLLTK